MNKYLAIVLDESGSMTSIKEEVVTSFNELIQAHPNVPFTLCRFNSHFHIQDNEPLTDYYPEMMTALYDAICNTVDYVGEKLHKEGFTGKVVLAIITDGYENASKQFTHQDVEDRLEHQHHKYGWEIMFLSSDLSAYEDFEAMFAAASLPTQYLITFGGSTGIKDTFTAVSNQLQ